MADLEFSSDTQTVLDEIEARTGKATRAKVLPAWALLFRSPFRSYQTKPHSWIGGVPSAPKGFRWPRNKQGSPIHFIAQIDLSHLDPEPASGVYPPGLPKDGALLVFAGEGYATRILCKSEMKQVTPIMPPADLCELKELGFWCAGNTFNVWAIDPVPYLSQEDEDQPPSLDQFRSPKDWITNWAIAALEASIILKGLKSEVREGRSFIEARKNDLSQGKSLSLPKHVEARFEHIEKTESAADKLISILENWYDFARAQPSTSAIDSNRLEGIFEKRLELKRLMKQDFGSKHLLSGNEGFVWGEILQELPELFSQPDFSGVPTAYQPFVEKKLVGWRGHRLFGLEPTFYGNDEDLRGQDPLISIGADKLLGTATEHHYGFSIWLNRKRMARGQHDRGQFIQHWTP